MQRNIKPCLWYDNNGHEAAEFYTSVFPNSRITSNGSDIALEFELAGQKFLALNGGPMYKFTPAVSMFVGCKDEKEIDSLYEKLVEGGSVLMELQEYPFAKKYCWLADRFGLCWQLILSERPQKISTAFLFVGEKCGLAQEAIKHYTSIFPNSKIDFEHLYGPENPQDEGKLAHGSFALNGYHCVATESSFSHGFDFSPAYSLMVECDSQSELDTYWSKLVEGGSPSKGGWLTDKYGVSWQVVPSKVLAKSGA